MTEDDQLRTLLNQGELTREEYEAKVLEIRKTQQQPVQSPPVQSPPVQPVQPVQSPTVSREQEEIQKLKEQIYLMDQTSMNQQNLLFQQEMLKVLKEISTNLLPPGN